MIFSPKHLSLAFASTYESQRLLLGQTPSSGGIIWADEADIIYPSEAKIHLGDKANLQSLYHQERYGSGKVLDALLQEMDEYDWSRVADIDVRAAEKQQRLECFKEIIEHSGITMDGSVLEFDTGAISIGHLYSDVVAMDGDPRNVKYLRKEGIRAIIGTIDEIPIEDRSFDYVLAFNPLVAKPGRGWRWVDKTLGKFKIVSSGYAEQMVEKAIEIARKKVLIVSVDIALNAPYAPEIEKKVPCNPYYVVYDATRKLTK